ncbi:uncharacterized protein JCM10292_003013 [Rhodotorula paludigena]|uniref:uncharacterized protein n=1 Tax=Rhodotorula paludigena TaxID=86838 RepID=UPI00316C4F7C
MPSAVQPERAPAGHAPRRARPFHPPANRESFKDLLIFEERLKQNHERLQKQRRKYEGFLLSLVGVIAYLAYNVFVLPSIYSLVHYGNVAMLLVAVTTLVLFFATGMYSEKIAYAHKFVPQANRALRPFNIYLNTRHRSRFSLSRLFGSSPPPSNALSRTSSGRSIASDVSSPPLSRSPSASSTHSMSSSSNVSLRSAGALRSPPASPPLSPSSSPPASPPLRNTALLPSPSDPVTRAPVPTPSPRPPGGIPLPPIPPAQNPRGELIFSSRVAPQFREGYERYRGEWERRRAEAKRAAKMGRSRGAGDGGWAWALLPGWLKRGEAGGGEGEKGAGARESAGAGGEKSGALTPASTIDGARTPRSRESSAALSAHAGGADGEDGASEPARSRTSSPEPWVAAHHRSMSTRSSRSEATLAEPDLLSSTSTPDSSRSPSPEPGARPPTPPSSTRAPKTDSPGRIRAESFSDLLTFDAKSESGSLRGPGLERSNSMRSMGG